MIIFSLFHSPGDRGWFYYLLLDLDWKSLRFTRLRPRAGARAVGFIVHGSRWGWSGQVFTGIHGLGLRQF